MALLVNAAITHGRVVVAASGVNQRTPMAVLMMPLVLLKRAQTIGCVEAAGGVVRAR